MRYQIIEHYNDHKIVMCECHVLNMAVIAFGVWVSNLPDFCTAIELYDTEEKITVERMEIF